MIGFALIFTGCLLSMVIYHGMLYLLYRQGKEYLFLAFFCACIMLRTVTLDGNGILLSAVLPLDFEYFKKMEYCSVYILMSVLPLYFSYLFPNEFPKKFLKPFVVSGVVFSLVTLIADRFIYYRLLNTSHAIFIVELIVIGVVLYRATAKRRPEAFTTLVAMACAGPLIVIEIAANSGFFIQPVSFLLELAMLIFLIFQAFILAKRNAKAFYLSELTKADLEKAIAVKTVDLSEANALKNTLLAVMSHDVKGPLNSIKGVLSLMNADYLRPDEMRPVTNQLQEQVHNTSILVENILHWSASQSRSIKIEKKKIAVRPLIDECYSLFSFQACNKHISLINEIPGSLVVFADENILKLVLRNLVANSLKFTNEGGSIRSYHAQDTACHSIVIEDNGVGMDEEKIATLFDIEESFSTVGTKQEVGTGLGLSLCKKFLDAMGSNILVESKRHQGTKFHIQIAHGLFGVDRGILHDRASSGLHRLTPINADDRAARSA